MILVKLITLSPVKLAGGPENRPYQAQNHALKTELLRPAPQFATLIKITADTGQSRLRTFGLIKTGQH